MRSAAAHITIHRRAPPVAPALQHTSKGVDQGANTKMRSSLSAPRGIRMGPSRVILSISTPPVPLSGAAVPVAAFGSAIPYSCAGSSMFGPMDEILSANRILRTE